MRTIKTVRNGEIKVDESKIVHFSDGIPAFEDEHEFLVLPYGEENPYYILQSVNTPDLAFLMTMPDLFFEDYEFELNDDVLESLGITDRDDILVYVLITIPGGKIRDMTVNLMAPIVLNKKNMKAQQVVLEKTNYTTKHRLIPSEKGDN